MERKELASRLGITEGFLGALERQAANPSFGLALKLCQVLGISMEQLFPYGNRDVGPSARGDAARTPAHTEGAGERYGGPAVDTAVDTKDEGALAVPLAVPGSGSAGGERGLGPVGVLDAERARLSEHANWTERRRYSRGRVFVKARQEGLLFAYEHLYGSQSTATGAPYGPQVARHPTSRSLLLFPTAFPQRPAISTLSGTLLSQDAWRKLSREIRKQDACSVCGGIGRKHPTECHAVWRFDEGAPVSTSDGGTRRGAQVLVGFEELCPMCRLVRRLSPRDTPRDGRYLLDRASKHLEKVNRWPQVLAKEGLTQTIQRSREMIAVRWTVDRPAAMEALERTLGANHEVVAEARERLRTWQSGGAG